MLERISFFTLTIETKGLKMMQKNEKKEKVHCVEGRKKAYLSFDTCHPCYTPGTTKLNFLPSPISFILQNTKRQFPLTGRGWTVCDCWLLNEKTIVYESKMSH